MGSRKPREYHFLVTLQWTTDPNGVQTSTRDGILTAAPGTTRRQLVEEALRVTAEWVGAPDFAVTLFVSVEPNEMAA